MSLKSRILSGEVLKAVWAGLGSPDAAEILVRYGWKVVIIDGEHGIGGIEQWVAVARAVEAAGGEVILRVPEADPALFKRVLDRGFRSLIVPLVNTADEARAIVAACRYPPRGARGYGAPIVRASGFGARAGYALEEAHEELFLAVQCEHAEAVENLPEIAAVGGIDMIFVGPNDLAGSIDQLERLTDPRVQSLLDRAEDAARQAAVPLGTIVSAGRDWAELTRRGYRLVAGPTDVGLIIKGARAAADEAGLPQD